MNNVEELLKLLIPAFFLVLWALNQLLNKESNAPQAPGRAGGLGPRPGTPPAQRPPMERPREIPAPSRPQPVPAGRDDDIVILRSETVRPSPAGSARRGQRQRSGRGTGRPSPPSGTRPGDGKSESRPRMEVDPTMMSATASTATPQETLLIGVPTPITAADLRTKIRSIDRIREAIILNEVLQPPLSRRGPWRS